MIAADDGTLKNAVEDLLKVPTGASTSGYHFKDLQFLV
jgi:hypothetical protein